MLKPYVCVACEKVIVDQPIEAHPPAGSAGPPSLINLFSKMIVEITTNGDVPDNAVGPRDWVVFSMWDVEPGDEAKNYILCMKVVYPDGKLFGEVKKMPLPVVLGHRSQMIVRINGFPIGQAGFYTVHTWLEEGQVTVSVPVVFKIELQIIKKELQSQ